MNNGGTIKQNCQIHNRIHLLSGHKPNIWSIKKYGTYITCKSDIVASFRHLSHVDLGGQGWYTNVSRNGPGGPWFHSDSTGNIQYQQ